MRDKSRIIEDSVTIETGAQSVWDALIIFSNYRIWNPVVNHAAIYGALEVGTKIKIHVGNWDFDFVIKEVIPRRKLVLNGRSIGIRLDIGCTIRGDEKASEVEITIEYGGLIPGVFKRKSQQSIEDSLAIFLTALKNRVMKGENFQVTREDEKQEDDEEERVSTPTVFNMLYKSRKRKPRKRSRLK